MLVFFDTFLEEHDFWYLLEIELIFNRESFESIFINVFIFRLDFNVMKNIRVRDRKVVNVKSKMFMFHIL